MYLLETSNIVKFFECIYYMDDLVDLFDDENKPAGIALSFSLKNNDKNLCTKKYLFNLFNEIDFVIKNTKIIDRKFIEKMMININTNIYQLYICIVDETVIEIYKNDVFLNEIKDEIIDITDIILKILNRYLNVKLLTKEEWRKDVIYNKNYHLALNDTPVLQSKDKLWVHQMEFIEYAANRHINTSDGARLILADEVGLGKTMQLGCVAKIIGEYDEGKILIIVPKALMKQWQLELFEHIGINSYIYDKNKWIDSNGNVFGNKFSDFKSLDLKFIIISEGLIRSGSNIVHELLNYSYSLVILDEAHKCRRKNTVYRNSKGVATELTKTKMNNLCRFLFDISTQTKSMILATATPIQLDVQELHDLIYVLSANGVYKSILGDSNSEWLKRLSRLTNFNLISQDSIEFLSTVPEEFKIRTYLNHSINPIIRDDSDEFKEYMNIISYADNFDSLTNHEKQIILRDGLSFIYKNNPFTNIVVRRTREKLVREGLIDNIKIRLLDDDNEVNIPKPLENLHRKVECLCKQAIDSKSKKFIEILLLRRLNSSFYAFYKTLNNIVQKGELNMTEDDVQDIFDDINEYAKISNIDATYMELLKDAEDILTIYNDIFKSDSKYLKVVSLFEEDDEWLNKGVILFSQFFDTAKMFFDNMQLNFPNKTIALYSSKEKSYLYDGTSVSKIDREQIKTLAKENKINMLIGTDAASEGLNLQYFKYLINIDLPYNPIRLEQRKGRIYRFGQINEEICIYNVFYKNSLDLKVYKKLSTRFENIFNVLGTYPDEITDEWIKCLSESSSQKERVQKKLSLYEKKMNIDDLYKWIFNGDRLI